MQARSVAGRSGRQALQSNNRSPPALSWSGARRITLVQVSNLIDPHAKVQDRGGRRPAVRITRPFLAFLTRSTRSGEHDLYNPSAAHVDTLHHRAAFDLRGALPLDAARDVPDAVGHAWV